MLEILWVFLIGLSAMFVHELGHLFVASLIGLRVSKIGVSLKGMYILREAGTLRQNLIMSLAGVSANALMLLIPCPMLRLANLCFIIMNLIPIKGSDGERALNCIKAF